MKLPTLQTWMMNFLQPGMLCITLALAACSHDKVETSTPVEAESGATIPAVIKPEITTPTVTEPARQEPPAEKPAVNQTPASELTVLKPGQFASINASTILHYVRLVSDSRCPVGTQCIWAGEATIQLTLESGREKQTFTLTDRANTKDVLGFGIELVSIDRGHLINIRVRKL